MDDESKPERRPTRNSRPPADWDSLNNPPYSYWCYYVYANLYTLNKIREARGLSTFYLRPHAGEAGDIDHLVRPLLFLGGMLDAGLAGERPSRHRAYPASSHVFV